MSITVPITLPDALAERARRRGILKSETLVQLIETAVAEAERQVNDPASTDHLPAWLDALGTPPEVADIDIDFPRSKALPRSIDMR
ncbi:MAG: hypothetical protein Q4D91_03450 [Lautropia sp.]|nr:hypothetical protein [Lautropia sp.]